MRDEFDSILKHGRGVATRAELARSGVGGHALDNEVKAGHLVRLRPRTFSRPWDADSSDALELAAVRSAGPPSALSHTTGLRRWDLPSPLGPVHLLTPESRRIRGTENLVVHRTTLPIQSCIVAGVATVIPEWAIVGSWGILRGPSRRAPVIVGVRTRLVTVLALRDAVTASTRLRDRAKLRDLLDLLDAGCQSELELWGYRHVFNIPGLRGAIRQRAVVVRGETFRLDMAYEAEKVAVELDGRAYHAAPAQWERDIARDLAIATLGWQTVRLSHRRLTTDVAGCRRDVLAVLAHRRQRT